MSVFSLEMRCLKWEGFASKWQELTVGNVVKERITRKRGWEVVDKSELNQGVEQLN